MIDPKWLRTDPDRVRRSQAARGASVELVDELIAADGDGGFIYLGNDGTFGYAFNTPMLAVAYMSATKAVAQVSSTAGVHLID